MQKFNMRKQYSILLAIVFSAFYPFPCFSAYTIKKSPEVITDGILPKKYANIFEINIQYISLSRVPMWKAIRIISNAIENAPMGKIVFDYVLEFSDKRAMDNDRYINNRKISIKAKNIKLGEVIDQLCKQAGWSYCWTMEGVLLMFVDSPKYHYTWRDAYSKWQGWHYKTPPAKTDLENLRRWKYE